MTEGLPGGSCPLSEIMKDTKVDPIRSDPGQTTPSSSSAKERTKGSPGDSMADASEPKRKKRAILVVGIALLVLIGVGVGAAGYLGYIPIPGFTRHQKLPSNVVEEAEPGPVVKLSPLIVNLKEEGGRNYLRTIIVMEVGKKEWVEEVQSKMSRLMDMAILTLSDKRLEDLRDPESKEKLKRELLVKIHEHLDPKKIKQIYFDEFLYQ